MAVGVDLPVGACVGQLFPKRDDHLGRDHRIIPTVEGDDLGLDLLGRQAGRIEQRMEAHRRRDIHTGARDVERAEAAEAIAGDDDAVALHLPKAAHLVEDGEQPAAQRCPVGLETGQLAEHHVAWAAAELFAEDVGDKGVVAELHELLAEAELKVGNAHHRRDEHYRRACLTVAPADEYAFELLAFKLERDLRLAAHSISFASWASLATVFMLRAVPASATALRSRDFPIPR